MDKGIANAVVNGILWLKDALPVEQDSEPIAQERRQDGIKHWCRSCKEWIPHQEWQTDHCPRCNTERLNKLYA